MRCYIMTMMLIGSCSLVWCYVRYIHSFPAFHHCNVQVVRPSRETLLCCNNSCPSPSQESCRSSSVSVQVCLALHRNLVLLISLIHDVHWLFTFPFFLGPLCENVVFCGIFTLQNRGGSMLQVFLWLERYCFVLEWPGSCLFVTFSKGPR